MLDAKIMFKFFKTIIIILKLVLMKLHKYIIIKEFIW